MNGSDNQRFRSSPPTPTPRSGRATPSHGYRSQNTGVPSPAYRATPPTGKQTDLLAERARHRLKTEARRRRVRVLLFGVVGPLVLLAIVGFIVFQVLLKPITDAVGNIFRPTISGLPGRDEGGGGGSQSVPIKFPDWSNKDPVNILLIGIDERQADENGKGDSRADTQIIVHIDPAAKTAAMVSVPRDLWVDIPGFDADRINGAYQKGEDNKDKIKGGGPTLAMATIQSNFGVPIQYYAIVNFRGFERIVDTIGGIDIDVPRPLADNDYPFMDYGSTRVYIPAGLQHMDGRTALEYARSRHTDSDIGRNSRQQQVLLAIRRQGLTTNLLPHLGDLITQLSDAVQTDMPPSDIGSLAQLAQGIDSSNIENVVVDNTMFEEQVMPSGADVLVPRWDVIRPRIAQAFANPDIRGEAARVSVQNGTTTNGAAIPVQNDIAARGIYVADLSYSSDRGSHPTTTITDYTGGQKPHTVEALARVLGISPADVKQAPATKAPISSTDSKPVDILVIVGDDKVK